MRGVEAYYLTKIAIMRDFSKDNIWLFEQWFTIVEIDKCQETKSGYLNNGLTPSVSNSYTLPQELRQILANLLYKPYMATPLSPPEIKFFGECRLNRHLR